MIKCLSVVHSVSQNKTFKHLILYISQYLSLQNNVSSLLWGSSTSLSKTLTCYPHLYFYKQQSLISVKRAFQLQAANKKLKATVLLKRQSLCSALCECLPVCSFSNSKAKLQTTITRLATPHTLGSYSPHSHFLLTPSTLYIHFLMNKVAAISSQFSPPDGDTPLQTAHHSSHSLLLSSNRAMCHLDRISIRTHTNPSNYTIICTSVTFPTTF